MKRRKSSSRMARKTAKAIGSQNRAGKRSSSSGVAKDIDLFVKGLVQRGEAVMPKKGKDLPAGATHEIVSSDTRGQPAVKRRRFSAH
jgi:hypothetical protein